MTIINITLPFTLINEIEDFSKILNEILNQDVALNILKFSASDKGINLLLDIPEEKVSTVTTSLKRNNVSINQKGRIIVNLEECIYCGACGSLCPSEALSFNEESQLIYTENKCIGCLLCLDSCPIYVIKEA
jgi:formate hydrogenlyase subunit 6/NADH:ubiquinone oxidoreductase subunit I